MIIQSPINKDLRRILLFRSNQRLKSYINQKQQPVVFCKKGLQLYQKETLAHVLSCEVCEFSKNTFLTEQLWVTASVFILFLINASLHVCQCNIQDKEVSSFISNNSAHVILIMSQINTSHEVYKRSFTDSKRDVVPCIKIPLQGASALW